MAKRLDVGVVLLAQLNREVERREDKMPNMADFRDAGSIEQDADCMVGLNRPEYWLGKAPSNEDDEARGKRRALLVAKANIMEIGIMKNRHGASDQTVSVFCDVAASVIRGEKPLQGAAAEITQGNMF
jgi:replicative DNA helicase